MKRTPKGYYMTTSSLWNFISAVENEYSEYRKRIMTKFSLTAAETDILMFLANNPQHDTAADVSKIRRIPKSQVSVSVKSLCEKGILTGVYKDGNKKSIHLSLTSAAKPIVTYGKKEQNRFTSVLFDGFTEEEIAEIDRSHIKIQNNINKKRSDK